MRNQGENAYLTDIRQNNNYNSTLSTQSVSQHLTKPHIKPQHPKAKPYTSQNPITSPTAVVFF